jgi:hypothetical protein
MTAQPTSEADDWVPHPAPTLESMALPPLNNEEPGERAMRLIVWAVTKALDETDLQ